MHEVSTTITGVVQAGFGTARGSGYPTANLAVSQSIDIPEGVYCARTTLKDMSTPIPSIVFYGVPHAIPGAGVPRFEVHLLEKNGNLYGHELSVHLTAFVRENKKFEDAKSLQGAIEQDIQTVRTYFRMIAS